MSDVSGTLEASIGELSLLMAVILQRILKNAAIALNQILTAPEKPLESGTQSSRS